MDRFQYIAESDPNIAFSKTLKQEPFFSSLHRRPIFCRGGWELCVGGAFPCAGDPGMGEWGLG